MRYISRIILFIYLGMIDVYPLLAQWVPTNGPYGGSVKSLAVNPDGSALFAGARDGLYISTDSGAKWKQTGLQNVNTSSITILPDGATIFAGTYSNGLYRSTDGGTNWIQVDMGFTPSDIETLVRSPDGSAILSGTNYGLFRSTDNGNSWKQLDLGLGHEYIYSLVFVSDTVIMSGTMHGVFLSTNGGEKWTRAGLVDSDIQSLIVYTDETGDKTVIAGTGWGAYRTTDNGTDWIPSGLDKTHVTSLVVSDTTIFASTYGNGIFFSNDGGYSWNKANNGLNTPFIQCLTISPDGKNLFAGTDLGIYRSTDHGDSWTNINNGLNNTGITSLTASADGSKILASTRIRVFSTTDNGGSWNKVNDNLEYSAVSISSLAVSFDDSTILAGTLGGIFRSTRNDPRWYGNSDNYVISVVRDIAYTPDGLTTFAATDGEGFLRSNDNGATWTKIKNNLPQTSINSISISDSTIFIAAYNYGVFRSTNNGNNWSEVNKGLEDKRIFSLTVSPDGKAAYVGTEYGIVYRTSTKKIHWTQAGDTLGYRKIRSLVISPDGSVILAGTNAGIFQFFDKRNKWIEVDSGMTNTDIKSLIISGTNVFAGTDANGVWRRPLSELTAVGKESKVLPEKFNLNQNYPNPFNPTTNITYSITRSERVQLKIYNISGQLVATLVDRKQAAGKYQLSFNGSRLSSGVYIYRLVAGNDVETRKMLLLK